MRAWAARSLCPTPQSGCESLSPDHGPDAAGAREQRPPCPYSSHTNQAASTCAVALAPTLELSCRNPLLSDKLAAAGVVGEKGEKGGLALWQRGHCQSGGTKSSHTLTHAHAHTHITHITHITHVSHIHSHH